MRTILFYGDSNTYGYDPRGMMGGRFSYEQRWTSVVARGLSDSCNIVEAGLNGRTIPVFPKCEEFMENAIRDLKAGDFMVVMLGTNDILLTSNPDHTKAVESMKGLIGWHKGKDRDYRLIITCPVPIADVAPDMTIYHKESLIMNEEFKALCKEEGLYCIDAGEWNVPVAYDGVHISEEGQIVFGENMLNSLQDILNKC